MARDKLDIFINHGYKAGALRQLRQRCSSAIG